MHKALICFPLFPIFFPIYIDTSSQIALLLGCIVHLPNKLTNPRKLEFFQTSVWQLVMMTTN